MADQKVNELTTQTPSLTDFLMGIGASAGSTEYKMVINDLAKAIIEQYTGSTVAGSAQTIKAALDALNSKASKISIPFTKGEKVDAFIGTVFKTGEILMFSGYMKLNDALSINDVIIELTGVVSNADNQRLLFFRNNGNGQAFIAKFNYLSNQILADSSLANTATNNYYIFSCAAFCKNS